MPGPGAIVSVPVPHPNHGVVGSLERGSDSSTLALVQTDSHRALYDTISRDQGPWLRYWYLGRFREAARVFERANDGCIRGRLVATTGIVHEQSASTD
jgi:hypothetical protein